jgi:hypothetical protein
VQPSSPRPAVNRSPIVSVRSGGQTGVDRVALEIAAELGIPYGGWCPRGGWAEDAPDPPGIRARYPRLVETPSADPRQRTAWNVRDSDATLVLLNGDWSESPGTDFTRACAELIFQRPIFVARIGEREVLPRARTWLIGLFSAADSATIDLNVAGPRESESHGIAAAASDILSELLAGTIG